MRSRMTVLAILSLTVVTSGVASAREVWYARASVGGGTFEDTLGPPIFGWEVDDEDVVGSLAFGARFHPNLAVEVGFHDLGDYTGTPIPCPLDTVCPLTVVAVPPTAWSVQGWSASVLPRWAVGERVTMFGRVGVMAWEADVETTQNPFYEVEGPDEEDLLLGLGVEVALSSRLELVGELAGFDRSRTLQMGLGWSF